MAGSASTPCKPSVKKAGTDVSAKSAAIAGVSGRDHRSRFICTALGFSENGFTHDGPGVDLAYECILPPSSDSDFDT